jgi:hypothetical protein
VGTLSVIYRSSICHPIIANILEDDVTHRFSEICGENEPTITGQATWTPGINGPPATSKETSTYATICTHPVIEIAKFWAGFEAINGPR